MQNLVIIFGIFLGLGIFFILLDVIKIPTLAVEKSMLKALKGREQQVDKLDILLNKYAIKLSKYVYLDEYKKAKIKNILKATNMDINPEQYIAIGILKGVFIGIMGIPTLVIIPIIFPVFMIFAILIYFKEIQKAENMLKNKKEKIENELPRFVSIITQELVSSRDVLKILENYKKSTSKQFANEIDILVADMRSSSYESALTRFETKFNSPMLSDVVRGLIAVLRGDDAVTYFKMLSHDLKEMEIRKLKLEAMKIPTKIRFFSFLMLMCFLSTYIVIIGYEIIKALGDMF